MAEETTGAEADAVRAAGVRRSHSTPAFASHIDGYVVPDHARLNEELLAAIAAWRAEDEGIQTSNYLGWHSRRDLFKRKEPAFLTLFNHIRAAATQSIRRYWPEFDPAVHPVRSSGWVNVNGKGGFNAPHGHSNNHLSGTYYITASTFADESGAIEFLNPAGALNRLLRFGEMMVQTEMRFHPKPGEMLIFPSHLRHWVYPNQEDEDRISIAFNMRVMADGLA